MAPVLEAPLWGASSTARPWRLTQKTDFLPGWEQRVRPRAAERVLLAAKGVRDARVRGGPLAQVEMAQVKAGKLKVEAGP